MAGEHRTPPERLPGDAGGPRGSPGWAGFLIRGSAWPSPLARAVTWSQLCSLDSKVGGLGQTGKAPKGGGGAAVGGVGGARINFKRRKRRRESGETHMYIYLYRYIDIQTDRIVFLPPRARNSQAINGHELVPDQLQLRGPQVPTLRGIFPQRLPSQSLAGILRRPEAPGELFPP